MIRSTTQFRGHKTQRAQYLIPYYTDSFFNKEEEKEKVAKCEKVSFPVKVVQTDEETRTNTQQIKVKVIDFFDSNPELILNVYSVIENRLVKPRKENTGEAAKLFLNYLQGVCSETAAATLNNIIRFARQELWESEFADNVNVTVTEDDITEDEQVLYGLIDEPWNPVPASHDSEEDYQKFLKTDYKRRIMNGLHSVTFGADAYRAFMVQKKYLTNQIVKPFEVTVEAAFRRVDVLITMMTQFPPAHAKGTIF